MLSYLKLCAECASVALGELMLYHLHLYPFWSRELDAVNTELFVFPVCLSSKAIQRSPWGSRIQHRATEEKTERGEKIWTWCFLTLHKDANVKPIYSIYEYISSFVHDHRYSITFEPNQKWNTGWKKKKRCINMLVANHLFIHFKFEWLQQPEPAAFLCWKRLETQESAPFYIHISLCQLNLVLFNLMFEFLF